jgi:hypothetical protein
MPYGVFVSQIVEAAGELANVNAAGLLVVGTHDAR